MSREINHNKIVVFTGAGVSAESGLQTFRDGNGLWNKHRIEDVASEQGWTTDKKQVLDFYNERRKEASQATPNLAHQAIAELETKYQVVVITQNVDDLHERGGSSHVIHLHGELKKARSTVDDSLVYDIGDKSICIGDVCEKGAQLRPHIVWFGEQIQNYEIAVQQIKTAAKVLVIGTSLSVFPAANVIKKARFHAEKIVIGLDMDRKPYGFTWFRGTAVNLVPHTINLWLKGQRAV